MRSREFTLLGDLLKTARLEKRWSQEDVASRASVSRNYVAAVERGQANVSIEVLTRIAAVLDISELPLPGLRLVSAGDLAGHVNISFLTGGLQRARNEIEDVLSKLAGTASEGNFVPEAAAHPKLRAVPSKRENPDIFAIDLPPDAPFRHATIEELIDGEMIDVWGYVAAGPNGLEVSDHPTGEKVYIPRHLLPKAGEKVLIARGESMVDVGINDGDIVIVKPKRGGVCARGEIIIAWYNGGIVIKEWQRRSGKRWLVSHNPSVAPIEITEEDVATTNFELQAVVRRSITPSWHVRDHTKISG